MTWIAAGLGIALVVQGIVALLALYRQNVSHQTQTLMLLNKAQLERGELLTRIQHPEVRIFPPAETTTYEPPRDAGEMAQVGQIVPYGMHVGTEATDESADQNAA